MPARCMSKNIVKLMGRGVVLDMDSPKLHGNLAEAGTVQGVALCKRCDGELVGRSSSSSSSSGSGDSDSESGLSDYLEGGKKRNGANAVSEKSVAPVIGTVTEQPVSTSTNDGQGAIQSERTGGRKTGEVIDKSILKRSKKPGEMSGNPLSRPIALDRGCPPKPTIVFSTGKKTAAPSKAVVEKKNSVEPRVESSIIENAASGSEIGSQLDEICISSGDELKLDAGSELEHESSVIDKGNRVIRWATVQRERRRAEAAKKREGQVEPESQTPLGKRKAPEAREKIC